MGMLGTIGAIAGGALGGFFGGPQGAVAGYNIGGTLGGSLDKKDDPAQQAAQTTADATNNATALQREMWLAQQEQQKPWLEAGKTALNKLIPLTDYKNFSMADFTADPGYGFRLSEGMKGLERSAAARGGLLSGASMKGIQRYGQDLASQEYMNAFNRYQTERASRLDPLQSLAGVGQTSAKLLGTAGSDYANNVGNLMIKQGYTAGNAQLASANNRSSSYNALGNFLGQSGGLGSLGNLFGSSGGGGTANVDALYGMGSGSASGAGASDLAGTWFI